MTSPGTNRMAYAGVLAGAFVIAVTASWLPLGKQIDDYAYDWILRLYRPTPWPTDSIILAIDEDSLRANGGVMGLRKALSSGLMRIAQVQPKAVVLDIILADRSDNESDAALAEAFRQTRNLVLPSDLSGDGTGWDDPLPEFEKSAAAIGHVHLDPDLDGVGRALALEKAFQQKRRWASSLEAFRVSRGEKTIVETPDELEVGSVIVPASNASGRILRIRYRPPEFAPIPVVPLKRLLDDRSVANQFSGKVVFAGATAQTLAKDRWITPYRSTPMAGVEVLANAYDTIAQQRFLENAPDWMVVLFCIGLTVAAGVVYAWLGGWRANTAAATILAAAMLTPYVALARGVVFPLSPGFWTAWLSVVSAAAWQHFYVRRRLVKSEAERERYQHAMQFVTHEMRTPLTAIQGSSELMSRYAMPEEKRKQIAQLIHSESKRLGRMIQVFLDVERLTAGEMELKKENFPVRDVMTACVERARPLADRKQIRMTVAYLGEEILSGDRELMEYAFYNLLTNAVKYSPSNTEVTVSTIREGDQCAISVRDQGIGMDQKEVRKIFQKFYRTKKAEQSGEAGTGIGLSIVEQIVLQHGGRIDVESAPGEGSCFTLTLPLAHALKPLATN